MEFRVGIHRVDSLDVAAIRREAAAAAVFVLPPTIGDGVSFFDACRATFPLDPPLYDGSRSWDALADSLCGGLDQLEVRRLVILWPAARAMETAASKDFEIALSVFEQVAGNLADERPSVGKPKQLMVLVELSFAGGI